MKFGKTLAILGLLTAVPAASYAHHSFSIYDLDDKVERTGVLTDFTFRNPHIMLELEVEVEDGSTEIWEIESMNPRRWDNAGHDRDVASVGETVTIIGWDAKSGRRDMALSAIVTERGKTIIVNRIRQRSAYR